MSGTKAQLVKWEIRSARDYTDEYQAYIHPIGLHLPDSLPDEVSESIIRDHNERGALLEKISKMTHMLESIDKRLAMHERHCERSSFVSTCRDSISELLGH